MVSLLTVEEYVFDTEALKDAYLSFQPTEQEQTTGYDEAALRTLIRYFADWGPARNSDRTASPAASLDDLSADEKRDLYRELTERLVENFESQYSRNVETAEFEAFLHQLAADTLPESFATFCLRYLWGFSKRIQAYKQDLLATDGQQEAAGTEAQAADEPIDDLIAAIHRLPSQYLATKQAQYEGEQKINRIRHQALEQIQSSASFSVAELKQLETDENARHETNIMQTWDEFTVLGQLYYDYFKPRIDVYLHDLTTYLLSELEIPESTAHHVNFVDPRNQLNDETWFALYPEVRGDKANAYQLFFGIRSDRVRYGLYAGDDLSEKGSGANIDIKTITQIDSLTIESVVEKFTSLQQQYTQFNGIGADDPPERPPAELRATIARQLQEANQVVFYGPPGTGKTFEAQRFAEWWVYDQTDGQPREEQVQSVTFHPSFSYEDFIEGLTASTTNSGEVAYTVEDGILKRIADRAQTAYEQAPADDSPPYVLIIDEINRGNLAQIFGETITLLEADKRESLTVQLAHSDTDFSLPPNLYVIGTMNTADRSIALVDAALRRRFRFIDFPPALSVLYDEYGFNDAEGVTDTLTEEPTPMAVLQALSIRALERLNENILSSPDLGKGKQIGHSYLFGLNSPQAVLDTWRYDVLPLLEEYQFGQFDRIAQELFDGAVEHLVNVETQQLGSFSLQELVDDLSAFVGVDIATDFTEVSNIEESPVEESSSSSRGGSSTDSEKPKFDDVFAAAQEDIYERVGDRLGADEMYDVTHPDTNRRTLRFESQKEYLPETVRFIFKPEPKRNGQVSVHLSSKDADETITAEVAERYKDAYDEIGFNITGEENFRIVGRTWELPDTEDRDAQTVVDEFVESEAYEEAIAAFVNLVETTDEVFSSASADMDLQTDSDPT